MKNPEPVEEMLAQSGLSDDSDVAAFLTDLHALGQGPAPAPSPALAAVLGATPLRRSARRRQRLAAGITALTLVGATATGAVAAANELPAPAQQVVSQWSHHYLPFHFPAPHSEHEGDHRGEETGEHPGGTDGHPDEHTGGTDHERSPGDGEHGSGPGADSDSDGSSEHGSGGGTSEPDGGTSDDGGMSGSHP